MHLPAVVSWTGNIEAGVTIKPLVSLMDSSPTILDTASAGIPDWMESESMRGLLESGVAGGAGVCFYRGIRRCHHDR